MKSHLPSFAVTVLLLAVMLPLAAQAQELRLEASSPVGGSSFPNTRAPQALLYDQTGGAATVVSSQRILDIGSVLQSADDFVVPPGFQWEVAQVNVLGSFFNCTTPNCGPIPTMDVIIYSDTTAPNAVLCPNIDITTPPDLDPDTLLTAFEIPLPAPCVLGPGTYWVSVMAVMEFSVGGQWGWVANAGSFNQPAQWQDPDNLIGVCPTWDTLAFCVITGIVDFEFQLVGTATLPVELTSFDAILSDGSVSLLWETASETNNAGFDIEHDRGTGSFERIGFVEGHGTTVEPRSYRYKVSDLDAGKHVFRLKQIDFDGAFEYSPEVELSVEVPGNFFLEDAYPNPFNPSTTVRFAVAQEHQVTLTLYDAMGKELRVLYDGIPEANAIQSVRVDGSGLASGTYMVRLESGTFVESKAIVLLK